MIPFPLNSFRARLKGALLYTIALTSPLSALASDPEFHFFKQPELDYWKRKASKSETDQSTQIDAKKAVNTVEPKEPSQKFSWDPYLDPKSDEFFREGEYLPPAPFMEIARDPSDENIGNWFKYLAAKNQITKRLQDKLTEYANKHTTVSSFTQDYQNAARPTKATASEPVFSSPDIKRFRMRLYFDSKCPHCEKMMGTLNELSQRGYLVELKQIDSDTSIRKKIRFPVTSSSPQELKQYQISSVPALLVGDLKTRTYFKIQGYQTESKVLNALATHSSNPKETTHEASH